MEPSVDLSASDLVNAGVYNIPVLTLQQVVSDVSTDDIEVMLSFAEFLQNNPKKPLIFCRATIDPLLRDSAVALSSDGRRLIRIKVERLPLGRHGRSDAYESKNKGVVYSDRYIILVRDVTSNTDFTVLVHARITVCTANSSSVLQTTFCVLRIGNRPCHALSLAEVREVVSVMSGYLDHSAAKLLAGYKKRLSNFLRKNSHAIDSFLIPKIKRYATTLGHNNPGQSPLFLGIPRFLGIAGNDESQSSVAEHTGGSPIQIRRELAFIFSEVLDGMGSFIDDNDRIVILNALKDLKHHSSEANKLLDGALADSVNEWEKSCPAVVKKLSSTQRDNNGLVHLASESILTTLNAFFSRHELYRQQGMECSISSTQASGLGPFFSIGLGRISWSKIPKDLCEDDVDHMVISEIAISEDPFDSEQCQERLELISTVPPWGEPDKLQPWTRIISPSYLDSKFRAESMLWLR
ncbi:MAG: hypothetical protein HQL59_08235 [Magnetococcales bacterium]|nr:hypothetical protein [Magnetococcales bacterium]